MYSAMCVPGHSGGGWKKMSCPHELELQIVVIQPVIAGKQNPGRLLEQQVFLPAEPPPFPVFLLVNCTSPKTWLYDVMLCSAFPFNLATCLSFFPVFQKFQVRGFVLCSEGHSLNSLLKTLSAFTFFSFWVCLYVDLRLAKQFSYIFLS